MNIVLLRVGIDTGCGGILGPLFEDNTFEFIPIPDSSNSSKLTYGSMVGRKGKPFVSYFPQSWQTKMQNQAVHNDPEFKSFTYGDPCRPKRSLRELKQGDLLVFYAGLKGWSVNIDAALYIIGYFEIDQVGIASSFARADLKLFAENAHLEPKCFRRFDKKDLVLIKGTDNSKLLMKAIKLSCNGHDCSGRTIKILSPEMQKVFGDFNGKVCIQRCPPRWVLDEYVGIASEFEYVPEVVETYPATLINTTLRCLLCQ